VTEKHTCPRRVEMWGGGIGSGVELDDWRQLRPLGGGTAPDGYRSCSYCGSLHPDDFMAAVANGDQIGPTDKSYKAYVGDPGYAKFSFQHLSEDQRREFIDRLNAHTIHIGYPGRFYVLPFFATRG
jgi:hypothetical protein